MTIRLIDIVGKQKTKSKHLIHPAWQAWMDASCYSHLEARTELGLANGTFYRRMAKPPTRIDELAMVALYEGREPIDYASEKPREVWHCNAQDLPLYTPKSKDITP